MDPRRQGQFMHGVFEAFFAEWQGAGHRAITPENLDDARDPVYGGGRSRASSGCPPQSWTGTHAAPRIVGGHRASAKRSFAWKPNGRSPVVVATAGVSVAGRIHDRDAGRPSHARAPGEGRSSRSAGGRDVPPHRLQARVAAAARARLAAADLQHLCGTTPGVPRAGGWTLGEAAYLAFKGQKKRVVPLSPRRATKRRCSRRRRNGSPSRFDAITRGEFPPTPDDVWRCETCSFASVCRKDYVGDV